MIHCPNCNAEIKTGVKKCDECGYEVVSKKSSHSAKNSKGFKGTLKVIIPVVAVLIVVAVVVSVVFAPSSTANYFGYFRDNEMFISDFSEGYGEQATESFKSNNIVFGNYRDFVRLSNDGKRLFYIDNYEGTSYKLYSKNLSNLNSKPLKITSDVLIYDISDDGAIVSYIKNNGYLYQHNLKTQSDLIDKDVINFVASDNGKTILYQKNSEGDKTYQFDLYISKSGGKGKKLVSNVDSFKYISQDFSTVYYLADGSLFKLVIGKKPVKLVDNVRETIKVYDSGEAYYTQTDKDGKTSLYYYNGSKSSKALIENYYRAESVSAERPVMVFCCDGEEITYNVVVKDKVFKIEQSVVSIALNSAGTELHFTADFDAQNYLTTLYSAKIDNSLKNVKKVTSGVFQGKYLSGDKYVYVKDYNTSTMTGTVYFDNKLVAENVYYNALKYSEKNNMLLYFDKFEDSNARLNKFVDGKSSAIRDNVLINSLSVYNDSKVVFIADCFTDDGILYVYDGGNTIKIDHDVSSAFTIITNEEYDLKAHTNF